MDAYALHSGMTFEERRQLVHDFQNQPAKIVVLVPCWSVGSYGFNWQHCHNIHLFDPSPSKSIEDQAIHRCRRIKQHYYVIVVHYYTAQSFNDYQISHNIKKALPGVMASLNDELMSGSSDGDETDITLGKWCVFKNRLTDIEQVPLAEIHQAVILDGPSFVEAVINETYGERVIVEHAPDVSWMDSFQDA
ncbi:MAG: hypothetical protein LQ351_001880 [Letrouitia transgressa]|nr:MAG: hypothetical protein LQ351_001880 [Letrouitia transgressa]